MIYWLLLYISFKLIADLNDKELTLHGVPDVQADWTLLGLMGHSAGNDNILKVIESNSTLGKVSLNCLIVVLTLALM